MRVELFNFSSSNLSKHPKSEMHQIGVPRKHNISPENIFLFFENNTFSINPARGSSDGGGDGGDGGRILRQHQPPPHHAQGSNIPFGHPLTPTKLTSSLSSDIESSMIGVSGSLKKR